MKQPEHRMLVLTLILLILASLAPLRHQAQQKGDADVVDVLHYQIDAEITPEESLLTGKAVVTLKLLTNTRSVVLEMNGSLVISKIVNEQNKPLDFLQDRLDKMDVRIDLGETLSAGKDMKLTFEYKGVLKTPEGGPVADRRLAAVGTDGSYLFYAARWFPFHKYAADLATYQINLTVPEGLSVAGYTQSPTAPKPVKKGKLMHTLTSNEPVMPGSLAVANYITRTVSPAGGLTLEFFAKPGDENRIDRFAQAIGKMLEVYSARFGPYAFGSRMQVAEIDDESLDYYVGPGTLFLSQRVFSEQIPFDLGRLAREVAYQWWGQAVALKTFDDAWLSQGLAQYSSLLFRQETLSAIEAEQAVSETMERALTFESAASIARAPSELYDLGPNYIGVVYYKGAFVFHMMRHLLGDDKFFTLLKKYYQTYRGKNASIRDFESLATQVAGRPMRSFFGQWVDSTGVPEFRLEYVILRTRAGNFKVRGTLRQNFDLFDQPVDLLLRAESGNKRQTIALKGTEATFEMTSESPPVEVVVDPDNKILRISETIRLNVIVRRGIEHFRNRQYPEAEQEFRAAIELDPQSSWAHYNLGLLYFEQRNCLKALDSFNDAINNNRKPSWVVVWSHIYRGNCYDANEERERAVAEYQKALDTGDNYNDAQQVAQQYMSKPFKYQ
ncbi:MAG: M1 family aminopeptidase [Acidobacteriota bacterium]|nr:M1 family aminopeptidase [Blastocatellia bacterium]MDW8240950.1 M1 family aminopeptidase [Acidobacteriota bacterium]